MYVGKDLKEEKCTFFFNEFLLSLKIVTFQTTLVRLKKKMTFLQLFRGQVFAFMVTEVKALIKGLAGR